MKKTEIQRARKSLTAVQGFLAELRPIVLSRLQIEMVHDYFGRIEKGVASALKDLRLQ